MTDTPAQLVTESLLHVFGERDRSARERTIARVFAADVEFRDAEGSAHGHGGLAAKAAAVLESAPADWVFRPSGAAQELGDLVKLDWSFGPAGGPAAVTGTDVAFVADGLINRMFTFLD
ncbi:SnoaL-like protein [Motilibacter peucedani]|uniref:SnoaL-like protein n=1 Tax=Motilibacter peucedani TaxID=598650 RepID=A0A420XT16_9ACTN|nr:nuclear transport factor 2 family protein [Motilibacter peucedani]RKS79907.1 SnoaL-like protein [Motilibacter peucedani]